MPERTMTEIMQDIDHLLDDLDASCRHGLLTYRRYPAEFLIEHDPRAAAANTYCHMLAESERCLLGKRGIVPKDIRGLKVFLVEDKAVLRLKRMDEDGRSRNYPTKQARDYDRGVEQISQALGLGQELVVARRLEEHPRLRGALEDEQVGALAEARRRCPHRQVEHPTRHLGGHRRGQKVPNHAPAPNCLA